MKFLIFGLCKFFKFEARKFHFLKMTTFMSGFLSFFEFGKLLPEIKEIHKTRKLNFCKYKKVSFPKI